MITPIAAHRCAIWVAGILAILAAIVLAVLSLGGCQDTAFVTAERSTYQAIAPEYLRYVHDDTALDAAARLRRVRTVELWDRDLRLREQRVGATTNPTR